MRHPYEKFIRIELASILLAVLIGIVSLIQGYLTLTFMCLYLISISLFCEALIEWSSHRKAQAGKQFIRAVILFILTTSLLFGR